MKKIIGKKILFYDTVSSTMDLAKKLIGNDNDIGTIIVAQIKLMVEVVITGNGYLMVEMHCFLSF